MTSTVSRVAARYKNKKKLESGNTLYQYSERQVALRNSKKAERLERLRKSVHKLRAQVKKDLDSGDPERVLTALAVGLMDHTAERVGNDESAEERGHFGVTGWQKGHVSFGKGKATVKYTGKSGVKQTKTVSDRALVSALRDAHAACEGDDLFCHDTVTVNAAKVNGYLKKFEITAKDLRGLHANTVMQKELKAARSKGGKLATEPKERKEQLKKEFAAALEATAEAVGHEPSTLKSQYLVPGVEEEFMKGRVMDKMVKSAADVERVASAFREKRAYSESTLDFVMAGMGMLLAQSIIVSNQFFDEREIKKYLTLRRQYHDTFAEACEDLAEEIAKGTFGEAAKGAIGALERIGAIPAKDAQRALRMAAKAMRGLKSLVGRVEGDARIRRIIYMANAIAARKSVRLSDEDTILTFVKELLKVAAVPSQVKTLLRKALKHAAGNYGRYNDTANPGAWFEMEPERQAKIRETLLEAQKEVDAIYERYKDDPEKRQQEYEKTHTRIERLKNVAGVNLAIIQRGDANKAEEPLDVVLKRESKLQADGPTEFVQERVKKYFYDSYAKDGTLPREHGKVLTQINKARTLDTVRRVLKEAQNRRLIYEESAESLEKIWGSVGKNLAVKRGIKLTPLQWEPISEGEFQKKHGTGKVIFDSSVDEKGRKETLGRVSRALEDLEGIFGKGFCGKHDKPLDFNFEGSAGFASASYFGYDNPGFWQPRVKFNDDFGGLLAHELSHFFDDLLATKISRVKNPEHGFKYRDMSSDLFGTTGVDLEYWVTSGARGYVADVIPELGEFADAVVATPDFKRWKDMTGLAHELGVDGAIKELTGQEYHDLPREHPYVRIHYDMPRFKSEWPPELLAATEKAYTNQMHGDRRKLTYYNSGVEVWARMVEQYVATKLAASGIANPWLTQLTYDVDVLPQMMDQETFEQKIVPILDKIFATIKERNLVAFQVANRFLAAAS